MTLRQITEKKQKVKEKLFGEDAKERTAVVAVFGEGAPKDVHDIIEGLETLGVRVVTSGSNIECTKSSTTSRCVDDTNMAFSTSDIALVFNEDGVKHARAAGAIPVGPFLNDKLTTNYNPIKESGNGFYFKSPTKWEVFAAIVRALETYQFPYDWENVVKAALK